MRVSVFRYELADLMLSKVLSSSHFPCSMSSPNWDILYLSWLPGMAEERLQETHFLPFHSPLSMKREALNVALEGPAFLSLG